MKLSIFDPETGTKLRTFFRALTVVLTTWVFKLDPELIAAIQLVVESGMAVLVASPIGNYTEDENGNIETAL